MQALSTTGAVSYAAVIPIVMGQNIGTCVTALLSSVGASKNARRAAVVHLSFNVIGSVVWLTVFSIASSLFRPAILDQAASYMGIAVCHSAFNILCTALLLPLSGLLEKIAYLAVPEGEETARAVELDERLIEPLRIKTFGMDNVEIIQGDILDTDLDELIESRKKEYGLSCVRVVGNLPYYITTPIIMKLLETAHGIDSITVMMQKEVGDRIAAEPGTRLSGAITYPVCYHARVSKVADAPRECFYPAPKVDSVVLRLDILEEPAVQTRDADFMIKCVKAGFSQRRKTLLNSLASMEGMDKDRVNRALERADIDKSRRAETLTLDEFAKLADILQEE